MFAMRFKDTDILLSINRMVFSLEHKRGIYTNDTVRINRLIMPFISNDSLSTFSNFILSNVDEKRIGRIIGMFFP